MHCGHAYMAYRNWESARLTGGEFIVIFDDTSHSLARCDRQGYTIGEAAARWSEDLAWLGLKPDRCAYPSEFSEERDRAFAKLGVKLPQCVRHHAGIDRWIPPPYPDMSKGGWYSVAVTADRVVSDYCLGVGAFWRGMDLKSEEWFYDYLGTLLGYPQVAQGYLPTVAHAVSAKVSQSAQTQDIRDLTVRRLREAGYEPWQIIGTLLECERAQAANGTAQIIIPEEMLLVEPAQWLEYRGEPEYLSGVRKDLAGRAWQETGEGWVDEQEAGLAGWWH